MQRPQDPASAAGTVTQYFLSLLPSSINTISLGLVVEANTNASSLAPYEVSIAGARTGLRSPGGGRGGGYVEAAQQQRSSRESIAHYLRQLVLGWGTCTAS